MGRFEQLPGLRRFAVAHGKRAAGGRGRVALGADEGKPTVALRILEARKAYAAEFDYRAMRECVDEVIGEGNVRLMQEHMAASLEGGALDQPGAERGG